ncbi:TlpA family protein disulfide reductase [Tumebacillus avium]|nr:redoxin domain-containing protein [Tumebacillus avium]
MTTFLVISNIVLWVVVILQFLLFFTMTRSVSQFLKRFQINATDTAQNAVLLLGSRAPLFSELDHRGEIVTLNKNEGRATLLLFTLDTCSICQSIIEKLPQLFKDSPDLRVIVVAPEDLGAPVKPIPDGVSMIRSHSIMENYKIQNVPFFVLIDAQGYVADFDHIGNISDLIEVMKFTPLKGGDKHAG